MSFFSSFSSAEKLSSKFHIPVEKYRLKNGLRVLLNPDDKVNMASYVLGVATGSRDEKPGITGISHMFEHLMFKGTKKYPELQPTYAENGVVALNAYTSHDHTAYHATFPPDKLELVLDVESDRMSNLTFTQEELDKERGAVQEERLLAVDNNPMGVLSENIFDVLFKKHSYRQPIIGYRKDIASYTLEDLRKWYKTYYSPNNAVLVISGKFSVSKAKKLIEKYFGNLPSKDVSREPKINEPEQLEPRFRTVNRVVQIPTVAIIFRTPSKGSKEFYALESLGYILGQGESSILYKKMVREKKLLSSIASMTIGLLDYGLFYIFYSLPDISKEQEIRQEVLEELEKVIAQGLDNKSLEKVKNIKMNGVLAGLRRSKSRAVSLLRYEINFNDYKKMYEKLDFFDEMSSSFIQSTGKKYLSPQKMSYLILKPEEVGKTAIPQDEK